MAKKRASNMNELNNQINKMLKDILNKKDNLVAETIKATESDMVEKVVYNPYQSSAPEEWRYIRRGEDGGLADMKNMWHEAVEDRGKVNMLVINLTPPNKDFNFNNLKSADLARLVEGGDGTMGLRYTFQNNSAGDSYLYLQPRPFQQETIKELNRTKLHVQALAMELRDKGLNTRMM